MKLQRSSYEWAIKHLIKEGDTDLFPRFKEWQAIVDDLNPFLDLAENIDINSGTQHPPCRRFVIPKGPLSYRVATQLFHSTTVILTALMYEFGNNIESCRIPIQDNRVFSYRFNPTSSGEMYNSQITWESFWKHCSDKIPLWENKIAVTLDIADYYNQIYHHTIENQLYECNLPTDAARWTMSLLKSVTAAVSRGIPVGPHATHLLAEMAMIPIDNSLLTRGIDFCRYVDDIVIFCNSEREAQITVNKVAAILDKQQRLQLQKSKTLLWEGSDFTSHCQSMIKDRPISEIEEDILGTIRKYSSGDPYKTIDIAKVADTDMEKFKPEHIQYILEGYLNSKPTDYIRLRWFFRRLSQVGLPHAIEFCLDNLYDLTPAISEICHYLISASNGLEKGYNKNLGDKIILLLGDELINSNEYFRISMLSLFVNNGDFNNFDKLSNLFHSSSNDIKREIILAATIGKKTDWLRELKESFGDFNLWCQSAFVYASHILPKEERKFFLKFYHPADIVMVTLKKWAKNQP